MEVKPGEFFSDIVDKQQLSSYPVSQYMHILLIQLNTEVWPG